MQLPTLIPFDAAAAEGGEWRLRSRLRAGQLIRVRRGVYLERDAWDAATSEARMRLRARALLFATRERPPVFAGISAAAEWELPLFRVRDDILHTIASGGGSTRSSVTEHVADLPAGDVVELAGLRVTSLDRTVFDVIRSVPPEAAVAVFDAALRRTAWRGWGSYDEPAAEALRAAVDARLDAAPGARGIRQARFIAEFADGRAQLPGESVSRLWMHRAGVPRPVLQFEVRLTGGRRAFPDFAWPALRRFGEFDGDGKYLDPALTSGRDARAVLREQRAREARVAAATGWAPIRWGMEHLKDEPSFAAFLRAQRMIT